MILRHLLESTLFAAVAALLALALRRAPARARYWVWLAASLKFLVPFSLLISIGSSIPWRTAPVTARSEVITIADQVSDHLAAAQVSIAPSPSRSWAPIVLGGVWLCGCFSLVIHWGKRCLGVARTLRGAVPLEIDFPTRVFSSEALIEPGIFGILRPVLLLPQGIEQRLTRSQMKSILAHELCHVRHRDNLTAAIHMTVEAIFWFHPLVWWLGARLVEERERACDEAVLDSGNDRHSYAESILQVCRLYLESPLECAAGVTGADLKKRIASIVRGPSARALSVHTKSLLATAAILSIAVPVMLGVIAPQIRAQSLFTTAYTGPGFEVAAIKPSDPSQRGSGIPPAQDGRFRAINVTARELIGYAYHTSNPSRISGGPSWLDSDRYDVTAKAEQNVPEARIRPMVLKLMQDRFALKFHPEQKQMQAYVLSVAKGGPKFKVSDTCQPDPDRKIPCGGFRVQNRRYVGGQQVSAADLAEVLEALIGQPVIDRTGIEGVFNMTLEWTPDERQGPGGDGGVAAPATDKPSLYTAIQEQLGLRLDLKKMEVDVIVVDSALKPTAN